MATNRPGLLFEANFDSGKTLTSSGFRFSGNTDSHVTGMAGESAAKITLDHHGSDTSYRSEIQPNRLPSSDFSSGMFAKMGQEYWYGMRVFLDDGWKQHDKADSVLMQFHSQPDGGEAWRNPPVALQVVDKGGENHFNLIVRSDASRITRGSGDDRYDSVKQYDLGPIDGDIGKWTDLVWHVKWNYNGDGFLELYKDGEKIADIDGANTMNDATGPFMKLGLYKYDWKSGSDTGPDSRTVYIDDLRVAGEDGSFDTVSSLGSSNEGSEEPSGANDDTPELLQHLQTAGTDGASSDGIDRDDTASKTDGLADIATGGTEQTLYGLDDTTDSLNLAA